MDVPYFAFLPIMGIARTAQRASLAQALTARTAMEDGMDFMECTHTCTTTTTDPTPTPLRHPGSTVRQNLQLDVAHSGQGLAAKDHGRSHRMPSLLLVSPASQFPRSRVHSLSPPTVLTHTRTTVSLPYSSHPCASPRSRRLLNASTGNTASRFSRHRCGHSCLTGYPHFFWRKNHSTPTIFFLGPKITIIYNSAPLRRGVLGLSLTDQPSSGTGIADRS